MCCLVGQNVPTPFGLGRSLPACLPMDLCAQRLAAQDVRPPCIPESRATQSFSARLILTKRNPRVPRAASSVVLPPAFSPRNPRVPRATWRTALARRLVWRRSSRASQRAAPGRILRRRVTAERSRSSRRSRDIRALLSLEPVGFP